MAKPVFQIAERAGLWTYGDDGELREATHAEIDAARVESEGGEVSHAKQASYTIVTADTIGDLIVLVCDLVVEGWEPTGAPFYVSKNFDTTGWHQALFMRGE